MKFDTDIVNGETRNLICLDEAEIELLHKAYELLKTIDSNLDYKSNPKVKPIVEVAYLCKEIENNTYRILHRTMFQT